MKKVLKFVAVMAASGALVASVLSTALAGQSQPAGSKKMKTYTAPGNLTVKGVLRVNKNNSIYGRFYAHGGAQVWQGLTIRSGVLKTDALEVTGPGPALFQSATIANNLQAGAITTTTISATGAATIGGRLTANGVDAGAGGLVTTGNIQGAALTASSITDTGALGVSGPLTGSSGTFGNLKATGVVDFSGAEVRGLSPSGGSGTFGQLNVGNTGSTNPPLTVIANNKQAQIGVNSGGALQVSPDLAVTGSLSAAGNAAFGGTLTVGGGTGFNGGTTIGNGSDLAFTAPSAGGASHVLANGDRDVAGIVRVGVSATPNGETISTVTYKKPYGTEPIVVLTPASDPGAGSRFWARPVGNFSGFDVHYVTGSGGSGEVAFYYHVIGS